MPQEGIDTHKGAQVTLEQHQGIQLVLGCLGCRAINDRAALGLLQGLLGGLVALEQTICHRLNRSHQKRLGSLGVQLGLNYALDFKVVVVARCVQLGPQVIDQVRVCHTRQFSGFVVRLERSQDVVGFVHKVEDVCGVFQPEWAAVGAVQAAQGLHGLDAAQALVHVHAAQQGLVKTGLEFVGHQQDLVLIRSKGFTHVAPVEQGVELCAVFRHWIR